jgi:hypothetical protein
VIVHAVWLYIYPPITNFPMVVLHKEMGLSYEVSPLEPFGGEQSVSVNWAFVDMKTHFYYSHVLGVKRNLILKTY